MTQTIARPALLDRSFELRATDPDGDGFTLEGYAAVFDQVTRIDSWEGAFDEVIKRGAFAKTITSRSPIMQYDHGRDARTGSVPIGAIDTLEEHRQGLFVRAGLFDNDVVKPIRQAIAGKALVGMSFRFKVVRESWKDAAGAKVSPTELSSLLWQPGDRGPLLREIREVELFELGPVAYPAYEGTSVGVRAMLDELPDDDREALIRELAAEVWLQERTDPDPAEEPEEVPPGEDEQDPDAGGDATSGSDTPDAGRRATSGLLDGERAAAIRRLDLLRKR